MLCADNGAFTLRIGRSDAAAPAVCVPNQLARVRGDLKELVAHETEAADLAHHSQLEYKRAHVRGLLVDCAVEEKVWERALSLLGAPMRASLVVSESPLTPHSLSRNADELYFERLGFGSVARVAAPALAALAVDTHGGANEPSSPVRVVVDVGYSATWVVPLLGTTIVPESCRRLDIGGKLLTNLLKEELTWRHFNLMDETHLVEHIKTQTCYVAQAAKNETAQVLEYLLPDYTTDFNGRVLLAGEEIAPKRQKLRMGLERFLVPECLFDPNRVFLNQAGLPEVIAQSIATLPDEFQGVAFENILITGGTARLPGLVSRLRREIQPWAPQGHVAGVVDCSGDGALVWSGARAMANNPQQWHALAVSRREFQEVGSSADVLARRRGAGR